MKTIYKFFLQLFTSSNATDVIPSKEISFFDLTSAEKMKIMRAAGKQAQIKQQQLLEEYEKRFGRTT